LRVTPAEEALDLRRLRIVAVGRDIEGLVVVGDPDARPFCGGRAVLGVVLGEGVARLGLPDFFVEAAVDKDGLHSPPRFDGFAFYGRRGLLFGFLFRPEQKGRCQEKGKDRQSGLPHSLTPFITPTYFRESRIFIRLIPGKGSSWPLAY
jgi:hypothetical protein